MLKRRFGVQIRKGLPLAPQIYFNISVQMVFSAIWLYSLYETGISGTAKLYFVVPVTVCLLHNYCTPLLFLEPATLPPHIPQVHLLPPKKGGSDFLRQHDTLGRSTLFPWNPC